MTDKQKLIIHLVIAIIALGAFVLGIVASQDKCYDSAGVTICGEADLSFLD